MTGHRVRFSCTLAHLDLEIGAGDVYGLIGANGAGKTITINLLLNVVAPPVDNRRRVHAANSPMQRT